MKHRGPLGFLAAALLAIVAACDGGDGGGQGGAGATGGQGGAGASTGQGGAGGALQPGQCRSDADCDPASAESCFPPGASVGCGACLTPDMVCADDTECANPGEICEPAQCACNGEKTCVPGCVDASTCAVGEACEALRCVAKPCSGGADCPANFGCVMNAIGMVCARLACADDAACDGTCVLGSCHDMPGTCSPPVP